MARNPAKEQAKNNLRADIQSSVTNVVYESNEIHQLISVLTNLSAGSVIGADQRLISHCQNVLICYSNAISLLNEASRLVEHLSTEDPDND